jgi:hypothetical protein
MGHDLAVNQPQSNDVDPRRVRIGLAIVTLIFLVALVLIAVVDDPLGRAMMVVVVLISLVRAALLVRSIRRDRST